jgi:hypothetical protein
MSRRASSSTPARRSGVFRALRIGPALALAIVVSVVIWATQRPDLQYRGTPPVVERVPQVANRPVTTPDISQLLKHADELALQPRQRTAIERLVKQWEPEFAERRREMQAVAQAFSAHMREAQQRGRGGLAEIQRNATPVSAMTTEWLARKAYFWQQGLAELTREQRERAQELATKQTYPSRMEGSGGSR